MHTLGPVLNSVWQSFCSGVYCDFSQYLQGNGGRINYKRPQTFPSMHSPVGHSPSSPVPMPVPFSMARIRKLLQDVSAVRQRLPPRLPGDEEGQVLAFKLSSALFQYLRQCIHSEFKRRKRAQAPKRSPIAVLRRNWLLLQNVNLSSRSSPECSGC